MKIRKTNAERREEILDEAEKQFYSKGYNDTTVADIIGALNIAKGTFYYYFNSKEKIMDAVIVRYIDHACNKILEIVENKDLTASDKLEKVFRISSPTEINIKKVQIIDEVNRIDAEIFVRSMKYSIQALIPIMEKIVIQGIEEGYFHIPYPKTAIELIIAGIQFLFKYEFFPSTDEEVYSRLCDFADICEMLLGTEKGALAYLKEIYKECI